MVFRQLNHLSEQYTFNYVIKGDRYQPKILFLHGFMGDCHDFDQIIDRLSDFCCVQVDLPGHGHTEVQQDSSYQMPNIAQALRLLLAELDIQQCILVGYSMGGRIALYLSVHFPQLFSGVILESASPGLSSQLDRERRIAQDLRLAQTLESSDLTDFIERWYQNPLFESFVIHPKYEQAIARRLRNDPYKLAKSLQYTGLGQQPDLSTDLAEIQIPLLLIGGELDHKFVRINQIIASLCPRASLTIVNSSGHNVHFEHSDKFSQLLRDFIAHL